MIVTAVEHRKNPKHRSSQKCLFWMCSDGVERTTAQTAKAVGLAESTILKRWHVYGVHWLVTKQGRVTTEEHRKYKLSEHKQYHKPPVVEPSILKTRSGKIVPALAKYDSLIPCPPAATGPYVKAESKSYAQDVDDSSVCAAKRLLKMSNQEMIAKGFLEESGNLVSPAFPSGYLGKHASGVPCNI